MANSPRTQAYITLTLTLTLTLALTLTLPLTLTLTLALALALALPFNQASSPPTTPRSVATRWLPLAG